MLWELPGAEGNTLGPTGLGCPGVEFEPGEERAFGIGRPGVAWPGQDEILTVGSVFVIAQLEALSCASAKFGPRRPGRANSMYEGRFIVTKVEKDLKR